MSGSGSKVAATRMNLLRASRRLDRVQKGSDLLRRKREALVAEVFRTARPAADARVQIAEQANRAWRSLLAALAAHGADELRAAGWPVRDLVLEMDTRRLWGVPIANITGRSPVRRTLDARGAAPGPGGLAGSEAADAFEVLTDRLLEAAPGEMLIRRLGEALGQTSRQVHTLERRVAPSLRAEIASVRRTLEEREREDHFRLKRLLQSRRRKRPSRPS